MLVCMEALGDITARIVAKLITDRVEQEKPSAGSREATSGGSALTGDRNRVKESAAASAGEDRVPHPVQGNVIDYRDSAPLLAAWGSRLNAPSKGAAPNHLKRPASKTCRASHRPHDPR